MSGKLGYTWYPKDFISDPDVMFMTSAERGVYRDLIDLAYMSDNAIRYNVDMLAKYTNSDVETVQRILDIKGKKKGDIWTIPSCAKRIDLANKNRANGSKGGRPKTETKPKNNPEVNGSENAKETQMQRQREREREREREKEIEEEKEDSSAASEPMKVFKRGFDSMEEVKDSIINDENSLMDIGAVAKVPDPKDVKIRIEEFFTFQKAIDKFHTDRSEFKKHFFSWYAKKYPNTGTGSHLVHSTATLADSSNPPDNSGKWLWLNNGWRDTTKFTDHQKQKHGLK